MSAPSSSFRNGRTRPRRPKTLGGDRFPVKPIFPGPGPARNIPGYGSRAQKLLARSVGAPENFGHIRRPVQKLRHFFSVTDTRTHGRTDAQTFPNDPCTTRGEKNFFCLYVGGNSYTTVNCAKFLPFHYVKLRSLRSLASLREG